MPRILFACVFCLLLTAVSGLCLEPAAGSGHWSLTQRNGTWWFVSPSGELFYSKGVDILSGRTGSPKAATWQAFDWRNFFPSEDAWRDEALARVKAWGFNTRGGWSDDSPRLDIPLTVESDLGRQSRLHWFNSFDPDAEGNTLRMARELTAPYHADPHLLGYFTDNEVGWWSTPIFTFYLQYGIESHTKKALWDMLYTRYQGDWNRLRQDFVPSRYVRGFEDLKLAGAVLKLKPGGRGMEVVNAFTSMVAKRYYTLVEQALRQAHPGALILGDRLPLYYNQHAVKAMAGHVDVISTNYNLDDIDGWVAPFFFQGLSRLTNTPVLVSEFFCSARENRSGNRNNGHLLTVDTQAQRAVAAPAAVRNFARFPNLAGAHWFQYYDEPTGGRSDGEDYNMGLVDIFNRPYDQLTQAFTKANAELEAIHARAAFEPEPAPDAPAAIPFAVNPVNLTDRTMTEWDKPRTRLRGFTAPSGFVPFGDVHLAWRPEGLAFFCLAQSNIVPYHLAYSREFPLSEAFQLHIRAGEGAKARELAVCLVPFSHHSYKGEWDIEPRLYQCRDGRLGSRIRQPGLLQSMGKPLPHVAFEGFIPARLLGFKELKPGQELRLNVWATMFLRDMTMSWAGTPPEDGGAPWKTGRLVTLEPAPEAQARQ